MKTLSKNISEQQLIRTVISQSKTGIWDGGDTT
jgi:hypothetical protein